MRGWTSSIATAYLAFGETGLSWTGSRTISEGRRRREDRRTHAHRLRARHPRPRADPLLARTAADQEAAAAEQVVPRPLRGLDRRPDGLDREDAAGPRARPDDHDVQPAHRRARDLAADALPAPVRDRHLGRDVRGDRAGRRLARARAQDPYARRRPRLLVPHRG